jgi:hypothetical protein
MTNVDSYRLHLSTPSDEDTLLVALMRGGETEKACALLHRRSSPRDTRWRAQLAA